MTIEDFEKIGLPDVPGIYKFTDASGKILYIGKATSLRSRVRSYFNHDVIATRGRHIVDMVTLSKTVDYEVTPSVLEALIMEANLIKEHLPKYNSQQKDNKSYNFVVITNEKFPKLLTVRGRTLSMTFPKKSVKYSFGPFPNGGSLREALKIIRKIFPYRDDKCVPAETQLEGGKTTPKPCFNRQIGLCPGVCTGEVNAEEYGRNVRHLVLFFSGKKKQLIEILEKDMRSAAKEQRFEEAGRIKRSIYSLDHINDIAIIKRDDVDDKPMMEREKLGEDFSDPDEEIQYDPEVADEMRRNNGNVFRIEAYDIAHMSGKEQVGVMVVVENGIVEKSWYRKFKIRTQRGSNDVGALAEVVKRRLKHDEWPMPNLIIMDGAQPQRNAAVEAVIEAGLEEKGIVIAAVVKDRSHKAKGILTDGSENAEKIAMDHKSSILLANAEAHRFAIAYHRSLRNKLFK
ncbi:MAG TPA: GIY-YIG nuclease family protein [Candidatus Paceibacterota bacterium]|nr:GIY-YIG nuclease family protein [Candidatus Paceibacterota bacterium]